MATLCNSRRPRRRTTPVLRETPSPLRRQGRRLILSHLRSRNHVLLRHQRKRRRQRTRKRTKKRTKSPSLRAVGGSPPRLLSANWPRPASSGRGQFFYYCVAGPKGNFPDVSVTAREVFPVHRRLARRSRAPAQSAVALMAAAPQNRLARTPNAASPRPPQPPAQCSAPPAASPVAS